MDMSIDMEFNPWKAEPVSPAGQDLLEGSWLRFEDEEVKFLTLKTEQLNDVRLPASPSGSISSETSQLNPLSPAARAELASKLLTDLEHEDYILDNENNSLDWFEQKTHLPIFDDLPSPPTPVTSPTHDCQMVYTPMAPSYNLAVHPAQLQSVPVSLPHKVEMYGATSFPIPLNMPLGQDMVALMPAQVVPQLVPQIVHQIEHTNDTASLLQEFENVYDETVLTLGALTPPQSPPGAPVLHELKSASPRPSRDEVILPHATDLTELDEIVRARAEETVFTSPRSITPASSCAQSLDETSLSPFPSSSPSPSLESSDDPDWVPSPVAAPSTPVARGRGRKKGSTSTKPYARITQEDKKLRKKEQNKNAATRYRLKKKMEVEEILGEEQELQDTNDQLKQRVTELSQEINYLKDLMRHVCRAKGLIK